jgi:hypothetical protein
MTGLQLIDLMLVDARGQLTIEEQVSRSVQRLNATE